MLSKATFLSLLFLHISILNAQTPVSIGETYEISSTILGEDRQLMVALPTDYEERMEEAFPVLYLLDAETNFHHTTACVAFLARNRRIPQMIVVGLVNSEGNRTRDLTPSTEDANPRPGAGGADNTFRFMQEELFPWVENRFRTLEYRTLVGHSFGGLFAIHGFIHHTSLFNSYLAISPSLWWDSQKMIKSQIEPFLTSNSDLRGHLYMTMADEGGQMAGGGWKLAAMLEENAGPNFLWDYEIMEEENHGTIPYRSTRQGLEFIFAQWNWDAKRRALRANGISAIDGYEDEVQLLYGFDTPWDRQDMMTAAQRPFDRGETQKAMGIYQLVTDKFPDFALAWQMLGECQTMAGNEGEAVASLRKALVIEPDNLAATVALRKLQLGDEALQVRERVARQYVGQYELDIGMTIDVMAEDGKLRFNTAETEVEDLFPLEEEHSFYLTSRQAKFVFILESGSAQTVRIETPEESMIGTKN
ncbi:MAG: alpha/beta hydrolase-fold protein [Bacteroidota bacterium]